MLRQPGSSSSGSVRAGPGSSHGISQSILPPPPVGPAPIRTAKVRNPNDCEIIVMSKAQQRYAEHVERSFRDIGLKVDLMFPKPDISVQTFITHITATGASFAVVIRPDNETHQSLSIHVLKPKIEEHRNMPLKTAVMFIKDRHLMIKQSEFTTVSPEFLDGIKRMTETHYLSDADYLFLSKYIQERWDTQRLIEHKVDFDPGLGINSVPQIQKKVMRVLALEQTD